MPAVLSKAAVPAPGSAGSAAAAEGAGIAGVPGVDEDDFEIVSDKLPTADEVVGFVTDGDEESGDAMIELTMTVVTAHLEGIEDVDSLKVICNEVGAKWR
jgi:hypothetical protein